MNRIYVVAAVLLVVVVLFSVCVYAQSVLISYSVVSGLRSVVVFRSGGNVYLAAWNGSSAPFALVLYNLNTSSSSTIFVCDDAGYIVGGNEYAYAVCGKDLYRIPDLVKIYSFYSKPYFTFFDHYRNKLIAFINAGFGTDVFVVDVVSGGVNNYGFLNWFIYGFGANANYYYTIQYNGVSWWLVSYTKDFSRVVRNVTIPEPLASNTDLTRYSAFAVNDLAAVVLFDGYTVVYDRDLNVVRNVSSSFVRVEATKYHFYGYDSSFNVYCISPTGYLYPVVGGLTYFSMVGSYFYMNDLGVVYDDSLGVVYIVEAPNDIAVVTVTVTTTAAVPVYVTRSYTATTTVYAFQPEAPISIALFFALLLIVVAIVFILRRK